MSNAIDILLVDGPANGRMICMDRAKQVSKIATMVGGMGEVIYVRQTFTSPDTNNKYHVAIPEGAETTDETILFEIVMNDHQPAWDLN